MNTDCESCAPSPRDLWERRFECELPGCTGVVCRDHAVVVRLNFDGRILKGWACTRDHANEIVRGWTTRDAFTIDTAVRNAIAAAC